MNPRDSIRRRTGEKQGEQNRNKQENSSEQGATKQNRQHRQTEQGRSEGPEKEQTQPRQNASAQNGKTNPPGEGNGTRTLLSMCWK